MSLYLAMMFNLPHQYSHRQVKLGLYRLTKKMILTNKIYKTDLKYKVLMKISLTRMLMILRLQTFYQRLVGNKLGLHLNQFQS
jgi:hypothetical protein